MSTAYYMSYNLPTPASLRARYDGYSALIIGTGQSTENLLKYKSEIKKHFDIVIGLNYATKDFEDVMDFHMVMEIRPIDMATEMALNYRKDLPRILNYKSIKFFPKDMNIIKARREPFFGTPNITKYKFNGVEGLLEYRKDGRKLHYGTVMLQALHFACILGCKDIYLIGADLAFKGEFDHYYKDKFYREPITVSTSRSPLIMTKLDGEMIPTTHVFKKSARYIDRMIIQQCRPRGIEVYDFSEGLINRAIKVEIDSFFQVGP